MACLLVGFFLITGLKSSSFSFSGSAMPASQEKLPAVRNLIRYSAMSGNMGLGYMLEVAETPADAGARASGRTVKLTGKSGISLLAAIFFALSAFFIYFARLPKSVIMQLGRRRQWCLVQEKDGMK